MITVISITRGERNVYGMYRYIVDYKYQGREECMSVASDSPRLTRQRAAELVQSRL